MCDRTFYDVGMANPTMRSVDPETVKVVDASEWVDFLEPVPRSTVVYEDAITFAISPWWNL